MPRFFFDFRDGDGFAQDDAGVALPHAEAAHREAVRSLPEVGKDVLPDVSGDHREVALRVRDEAGRQVLLATLTLTVVRSA